MQLVMLAEEHPRALNHDLIRVGHRVRDLDDPESGLVIADLLDLVAYADTSSAIYRALNPDWEWDLGNQLMAYLIDFQQMQAWAEGGKSRGLVLSRFRVLASRRRTETKYTTRKKSTRAEIDAYLASRVKPKQ